MKVLFLDVDGVLNSEEGFKRDSPKEPWYLQHDCLERFRMMMMDLPDVKVVLSSAWRLMYSGIEFKHILEENGVDVDLIGSTPVTISGTRGDEIGLWLASHPEVKTFVILDDGSDMGVHKHRLVKTTFKKGLQDTHVAEIKRLMA